MDAKDAYIEQLEIPIPEITYLSFPTYYFLLHLRFITLLNIL